MTAPTPPSPNHGSSQSPPPYDPWGSDPRGKDPGGDGGGGGDGGAPAGRDVLEAAAVAAAVAVLGVALGLLWLWLAPRVPLISDGTAVYLKDSEGEETVGADGTFVLLALGIGALSGAAVFLARRRGGVGVVIGLAAGALAGSLLAWWLGVQLGPDQDVVARARAVGEGRVFDAPLELHAKGALLAWPLAALGAHLALTSLFGPRDPEPARPLHPGWGPPPGGAEDRPGA
ncbi:hypothetical protein ACLIYM_25680 [Streptomyces fenghuangensis]|uniref:ABC transporter permease n=1 Tax=Streptomyces chitinivorans TaxID=1257027 RepID=A0ABW7HZ89_9ACTN|nr:hypothetical protein [Streptomyces chitinivorans]MDH2409335.1 hypothetical protein [Streptomyces chitinivorans]